ncbi:hypothetical protein RFI_24511, partial [Reticulomyxa filosa]
MVVFNPYYYIFLVSIPMKGFAQIFSNIYTKKRQHYISQSFDYIYTYPHQQFLYLVVCFRGKKKSSARIATPFFKKRGQDFLRNFQNLSFSVHEGKKQRQTNKKNRSIDTEPTNGHSHSIVSNFCSSKRGERPSNTNVLNEINSHLDIVSSATNTSSVQKKRTFDGLLKLSQEECMYVFFNEFVNGSSVDPQSLDKEKDTTTATGTKSGQTKMKKQQPKELSSDISRDKRNPSSRVGRYSSGNLREGQKNKLKKKNTGLPIPPILTKIDQKLQNNEQVHLKEMNTLWHHCQRIRADYWKICQPLVDQCFDVHLLYLKTGWF